MAKGTAQQEVSRLHQWIARASFPEERNNCKAFTFSTQQDDVVLKNRCNSWDALFHSEPVKATILRDRGLSQQQWHQSMRDVDVSAPEYLPDWAKTFIDLYEHWQQHGESINAKPPSDKPYLKLTVVWAELCRPWLNTQQDKLKLARIRLAEPSVDDLLENIMSRIATPVFGVLNAYPGSFPVGDEYYRQQLFQTLGFWKTAFDRQPILVKIIGNLVLQWRIATEEMLDRFVADLPKLTTHILQAKETQADEEILVSRLSCGLGDPHRGGRSVAIFETSRGDVVYKPKDLISTWATGLLLQDLHLAHSEFVPLTPVFLYCNGYGWERRVHQLECSRLEEVEIFYRRLGGWLFLLQLLNGNDFWYDNLIACADMPYYIDYETIVGNSFDDYWITGKQNEHIEHFRNMHMVGILPLLMPGSVHATIADGIDISITTPPGKQRLPFPKNNDSGSTNADQTGDYGVFDDFEVSDYAPFYQGEFQDINAFLEIFIDGYRSMGKLLKSDIGYEALQQFYQRIEKARFRHIVVDTWQCYSLLFKFFRNCGNDGVRATIALDSYFSGFKGYPYRVVEGIRNDIWNNDIPLFELQTNSLRLFNTSDVATENFFKDTALTKIKQNYIYLLNETERQVDHIKALFSTRPDNPRRPWREQCDTSNTSEPITDQEILILAQEIGDQLASLINQAANLKDCLAIGRIQLNNDRIPQPLPINFDGCSGITVFLAVLQQYSTDNNDHIKALHKCYQYLTDSTIEIYQASVTTKNSGVLSVFSSKLVALCRLARVEPLIDNNLVAHIEKLIIDLLRDMRNTDSLCVDYQHGISGLLYLFKELEPIFNTETLTDWIEQILTLVETKPLQVSPEQTDTYRKYADAFLPDAVSGMPLVDHYMQDRWQVFTAHPGYLKLRCFIASQPEEGLIHAPSEHLCDDLLTQSGEALMDRLYLLLVSLGNHSPRTAVDCLLNELVQRKRSSQRWFPDRWANDEFLLSAIHGQADMGLLLLSVYACKNLNPFRAP